MTPSRVIVRAYARSANLGPGYDVFSVALDGFSDVVEAWVEHDGRGVTLDGVEGPYRGQVPTGRGNVLIEAARLAVNKYRGGTSRGGIVMRLYKGVPPGKGLGSSGASAAAGVVAVSLLSGAPVDSRSLIELAGMAEASVSGTPHYDNVASSILGGFNVVGWLGDELVVENIGLRARFLVAVPDYSIPGEKTRLMRKVLPSTVPLSSAVRQWGRIALMVKAAENGDLALFGALMMSDEIVERARSKYVPCYGVVRRRVVEAGGLGVAVSGAGPSLLILAGGPESGNGSTGELSRVVEEAYSECGIGVKVYECGVGPAYEANLY